MDVISASFGKPSDSPEGSSPEMLEIFLLQVHDEGCDDRYVVGEELWSMPQDFCHGFRAAPADSAGLVVDEPQEPAQELANVVGVIFGDAGSGHPQRFDRAPANLGVCIVSRCDEASQDTLPSRCQFGNFFETAPFEEFV